MPGRPDHHRRSVARDPRRLIAWWAHQDLNLEPTDHESAWKLANYRKPSEGYRRKRKMKVVPHWTVGEVWQSGEEPSGAPLLRLPPCVAGGRGPRLPTRLNRRMFYPSKTSGLAKHEPCSHPPPLRRFRHTLDTQGHCRFAGRGRRLSRRAVPQRPQPLGDARAAQLGGSSRSKSEVAKIVAAG